MKMSFAVVLAVATTCIAAEKKRDIERSITANPSQKIELLGFKSSDVEFKSWDKNEVSIKISVSISSSNDEFEEEYIKAVRVTDKSSQSTLTIRFEEPEAHFSDGFFRRLFSFGGSYVRKEIRGEIYLPKSNALYTDMRYGSLTLDGMKGPLELDGQNNTLELRGCSSVQVIKNDYGKATLTNCGGNLKLECQSGSVKIEDFKGAVDLNAKYSNISVVRVSDSTTIESQSATLNIEDILGNLTVNSDYSNVTISKASGFVDVSDKSGKIRIKAVDGVRVDGLYSTIEIFTVSGKQNRPITIKGQSGKLVLADAVGDVKIDNPYSTIELRNIRGNIDLESQSGRIEAANISGNWKSETPYSTVAVSGLSAQEIRVRNQSNPVDLEVKSKPVNVDIVNQYGNVTLTMPLGYEGSVRLKATYGNIRSNLPVEVEEVGSGAIAIGKMGGGSGSLRIETTSGNIKVTQK